MGLCSTLFSKGNHKVGSTLGFKIYYGPYYVPLHYYKEGGYYIYYDAWEKKPNYGVDFGLFYTFKRISGIVKYDTARNNMRFGIGFSFGQLKKEYK